jgi:hypothetical protein
MGLRCTLLRALLVVEALLFWPALPAWNRLTEVSPATQAYLLCIGVFSAVAAGMFFAGKPWWRIWAWAVAATNLPVFPWLTPAGLVLCALVVSLSVERLPKPAWPTWNRAVWFWLGALLFCWGAAWNVHRFSQVAGLPYTPPLLLFGGLWIAVPLSLFAHQAGHWIAGRYSGMTAVSAWSGWADSQPATASSEFFRRRLLLWTLGGPLASLALGALLLVAFVLSPESPWAHLGELAGLSATASLALFGLSILPWQAAGYRSDGAVLMAIMRHGVEYRRDRALALIAGDWLRGTPPRNWNPEELRTAAAWNDLSRQHAMGCGFNYLFCLDQDFDSSTRFWIGRLANDFAQDRSAVPVRWKLEIAYFLAAHDRSGRIGQAPGWRRSAGSVPGELRPVALRADAALAIARGQSERAASLILAAEESALRNSDRSAWELEWNLLSTLRGHIAPTMFDRPRPGSLQWSELVLQRE